MFKAFKGYVDIFQFAKKKMVSVQVALENYHKGKYPGAFQDVKSGRYYIPKEYIKR